MSKQSIHYAIRLELRLEKILGQQSQILFNALTGCTSITHSNLTPIVVQLIVQHEFKTVLGTQYKA